LIVAGDAVTIEDLSVSGRMGWNGAQGLGHGGQLKLADSHQHHCKPV
jgi:hypothetical protein